MKLLFILCESSVDDRITEILSDIGAPGYSRFTGMTGSGVHGRREGSPVWPGLNTLVLSCMPDDLVSVLQSRVDALKDERDGRLAIRVFASPVDEIL